MRTILPFESEHNNPIRVGGLTVQKGQLAEVTISSL